MRYLILALIAINTASTAFAAEFSIGENLVQSFEIQDVFDCDDFQVTIKTEQFPREYETEVPNHFRIDGFFGTASIINKEAEIASHDGLIDITASQLPVLSGFSVNGRTFLPQSVACYQQKLIIAYWSGGNCQRCEEFLSFNLSSDSTVSYQPIDHDEFLRLKKVRDVPNTKIKN